MGKLLAKYFTHLKERRVVGGVGDIPWLFLEHVKKSQPNISVFNRNRVTRTDAKYNYVKCIQVINSKDVDIII